MDEKTVIRAQAAPWRRAIELLVRQGERVATNMVMETFNSAVDYGPTVRIDIDEAQTLMDDLWHAGIRPTEGTGSAGSLRATEKHLADMRSIVFAKLGIKKIEEIGRAK